MAGPRPLRDVLDVKRVPVDAVGHHHQHLGEVLQREHVGRLVDLYHLHGHVHPAHLSGVVVLTRKGRTFVMSQLSH